MIFLENVIEDFRQIINQRALQVLIISFCSLGITQLLKYIIYSVKNKKNMWKFLVSTGGFPSSHTSFCVSLCISLGILQWYELRALDWSFAVAVVFSCVIIHDAMGVRYEASKHATILNNLTEDLSVEDRKELGFGPKGNLKELLGHKGYEVLGGIFFGIIIGIVGSIIAILFG